jgi:hypothetical protein
MYFDLLVSFIKAVAVLGCCSHVPSAVTRNERANAKRTARRNAASRREAAFKKRAKARKARKSSKGKTRKSQVTRVASRYARIARAQRKLFRRAIAADYAALNAVVATARTNRVVPRPILRTTHIVPRPILLTKVNKATARPHAVTVNKVAAHAHVPATAAVVTYGPDLIVVAQQKVSKAVKALEAFSNVEPLNRKGRHAPKGMEKGQKTNYKKNPAILPKVNKKAVEVAAFKAVEVTAVANAIKGNIEVAKAVIATPVAMLPTFGGRILGGMVLHNTQDHDPDAWVATNTTVATTDNDATPNTNATDATTSTVSDEKAQACVTYTINPFEGLKGNVKDAQYEWVSSRTPIHGIAARAALLEDVRKDVAVFLNKEVNTIVFGEVFECITKHMHLNDWLWIAGRKWATNSDLYVLNFLAYIQGYGLEDLNIVFNEVINGDDIYTRGVEIVDITKEVTSEYGITSFKELVEYYNSNFPEGYSEYILVTQS